MDRWTSPPLVFLRLLVDRKGAFSALLSVLVAPSAEFNLLIIQANNWMLDVVYDSQGPDDV